MSIRILTTDLHVLPMQTRMPFRYGIATLTKLPHLFVRIEAEVDGRRSVGIAADGLAPKWFTKNPATSAAHDTAEMLEVIQHACALATTIAPATSVFGLWHALYTAQGAWGEEREYPPLLWNFGVSLVERALIDAFCRTTGTNVALALRDGTLGFDPTVLHAELLGRTPIDLLPPRRTTLIARHTVGLSDPLTDDDIAAGERLDDGLPQSLAASARAYGLTHFKIKINGDHERDLARLGRIAAVLDEMAPGYVFTLDGNEQYHDVAPFQAFWESLHADRTLAGMLKRLLFVEQPFHRNVALGDDTGSALRAWHNRPPIIIDESDGAIDSFARALELGYSGTSHKNCKGVFKGAANACLAAARKQTTDTGPLISGEDLSNVGPIALLQDLAVMAALGIKHVERNGHHYFAGLSMFAEDVQNQVVEHHGDLYRRHERGFATVDIRNGQIDVASVAAAPFGYSMPFDVGAFQNAAGVLTSDF